MIVNIPAFRLHAFRGSIDREDDMLAMDVVVGGSFDSRTPVFAAEMKYLVFQPYWDVPVSIIRDELAPKALSDPGFLERQGMVIVDKDSQRAAPLPATRGNIERIGQDLHLRQLPGSTNALGRVKFILPNAHDVYLHDTPARRLFARARRDLSHGCIRLSDPAALAAHVLRDRPEWGHARIRAAMDGEVTMRVDLTRPVPVLIIYSTAVARENGEVYFYSDIYQLDEALSALLEKGYPYPR